MATCNKQHRYLEGFNELPEAQDNRNGGRHICAACAYEEGLKDALIFRNLTFPTCLIVRLALYVIKVQLPPITLDINMVKKSAVKFLNFFFTKQIISINTLRS